MIAEISDLARPDRIGNESNMSSNLAQLKELPVGQSLASVNVPTKKLVLVLDLTGGRTNVYPLGCAILDRISWPLGEPRGEFGPCHGWEGRRTCGWK
jgi:hypothetical protein